MILNFRINKQILSYIGRNNIVAGSDNYLSAKFEFINDDWGNVERFAQFVKGDYTGIFKLDEDFTCAVPWEVVNVRGEFTVTVYATDTNNTKHITANSITIEVLPNGRDEIQSNYPTQDYISGLLLRVVEVDNKLKEAKEQNNKALDTLTTYNAKVVADNILLETKVAAAQNAANVAQDFAEKDTVIKVDEQGVSHYSAKYWRDSIINGVVPDHSLTVTKLANGTLGFVTPEMFGAVGNANYYNSADGHWYVDDEYTTLATDDTQAWISACTTGKNICAKHNAKYRVVTSGTSDMSYTFQLQSGVTLDFDGATLCWECLDTEKTKVSLLSVLETKNIKIFNGNIIGTKDFIDNTEYHHGIKICAGENIAVENMHIQGVSGDGIGVDQHPAGSGGAGTPFKNVSIKNCIVHNYSRNGISVYNGNGLLIDNCTFYDADGWSTLNSGIDVEPNHSTQSVDNLYITNCRFSNCLSGGIHFSIAKIPQSITAIVDGCVFDGQKRHFYIGGIATKGFIKFSNSVSRNGKFPINIARSQNNNDFKVYVNDISIENANPTSATDKYDGSGVSAYCNTMPNGEDNIRFDNITFTDKQTTSSIYFKCINVSYRGDMPTRTFVALLDDGATEPQIINLEVTNETNAATSTLSAGSVSVPSTGYLYPVYVKSSATADTNVTIRTQMPKGMKIKFVNKSATKVINISYTDANSVAHTGTVQANSIAYWDTTNLMLV